jgi:flagellar hook assembly protein FlgD
VKLEIFNLLGQKIKAIIDGDQTAGDKEVIWDGKNENGEQVASGVYLYRLQTKDFVQTRKMVLMK